MLLAIQWHYFGWHFQYLRQAMKITRKKSKKKHKLLQNESMKSFEENSTDTEGRSRNANNKLLNENICY